jgi:elongation factor P--(R)-beta-lysine ligase
MTSNDPSSHFPVESFRPTATLALLRLRSDLLAFTRSFFQARGFWEVETPILSRDVVVDAYLEPFVTRADSSTECQSPVATDELFLQTSPEFGMKRLITCGAEAIFQITRAFRRDEIGPLHNPEFTIVEWYRVDSNYREQIDFVEEFVAGFIELVRRISAVQGDDRSRLTAGGFPPPPRPFQRLTYDAAFRHVLGHSVIGQSAAELASLASALGIHAPASLAADDVDGWLNLLLALKVEPDLAARRAVFLYDYPPGQAALARIRDGKPAVAERFELYLSGMEICNGYQELTDPEELRRRIAIQSAIRRRDARRPLPSTSRLLDAMEAGLPSCAGVALGFDRLLTAATGAASIADVMAFPFDRA